VSRRRIAIVVVAVLVVAITAVGLTIALRGDSSASRRAADAFLSAWARGDAAAMAASLDAPPADFANIVGAQARSAPGTTLAVTTTSVTSDATAGTAKYHARLDVAGFGPYEWDGQWDLVKVKDQWKIHWAPVGLFPGLADGQRLVVHKTWPARAPILGADGSPLVSDQPGVSVGLEPDHITNLDDVKATLTQLLAVDPAAVDKALAAPGVQPNFFVPIITLRNDRYDALRPQLAPVPGIVFQRTTARLAVQDGLASQVLGRVGEITAERLMQLGPPYAVGDVVGLAGLELVYETRLAGRPSGDLDITGDKGNVVRTLQSFPGTDPQAVEVTLDATTQLAADQALAGVTQPAAIVALDATTGELRAVVSTPRGQEFNRALDGQYPPGSTFKVVTATALLSTGVTADSAASCPPSLTVGGRQFTNFEGEAAGSIPFHEAFAISCNTAFIGLASQLPPGALADSATSFGFGVDYGLPLPTTGGAFPTPADDVERAAAAIGQGRVTVSPLHMATVAATAASGQWRPPVLVVQPRDTSAASPLPAALSPAVADTLRSLMSEVVTSGTGRAAAVRGQQIAGKTGTAEFGAGSPPSTHAWFIGFRGNLAFAVLVEGGGVGGQAAAPVAARFLAAVPG
jgi:cell division protein FtsI/penicillin-binding protein 2